MLGTFALSSGYYEAYYGRAQRVRTKIADDFRDGLRAGATSSSRRPRRRSRSSSASAPTTRSRCTCPTTARCRCRWPASRDLDPAAGWPTGLPVGFQIAGPAFSENRILDAAYALEQAIGFDDGAAGDRDDYEPVIGLEIHVQLADAHEDVLRLRALVRRASRTRARARSASAIPGALPVLNAQAVHYGLMIALALGCESRRARSSTARTTSIPTSRRRTRSASTTSRSAPAGTAAATVRIHRVHLEEDAAKLIHSGESGRIHGAESSDRRLQPRRHAAGRDRDRARPALGRARRREFGRLLRTPRCARSASRT